jgi:hypothetical protein
MLRFRIDLRLALGRDLLFLKQLLKSYFKIVKTISMQDTQLNIKDVTGCVTGI